ncbi:TlpA family protein disulfide reductase [Pedobacter yonginense]|uniref:TlpA family protein disulfide reductase n=1 Tax=Pedobacter yonginense TaxID=651869 RepID=A0A317EPF4_9SPHI|nr:TlpA disulfide reductase family protein [Pedobacter yonginense]PWS28067.1 TlpA family protein disulfide reductase [Pedobacter yonginense]
MKLIKQNIFNIIVITLLLVIVLVPDAKAFVLRGLMEIGLYAPKTEVAAPVNVGLEGIRFKDEKGKIIDLGDLKGKVIFLNFWATWCPPCRAEMPSLNTLYRRFKNDKNVIFIFADADGDLPKAGQFMLNKKFELPIYKAESSIPEQIFKSSLPTTVIFDKQGRLSFKHEGLADYSDQKFIDFIEKLKSM